MTSPSPNLCACCGERPGEVILRIEFADAVDRSPWCMDCAADVVEQGYGEVVDTLLGGVTAPAATSATASSSSATTRSASCTVPGWSQMADSSNLRSGNPTEDDLRAWVANNPYFGSWDEWVPVYNRLPVQTRAVLAHLHGRHDDAKRGRLTDAPYAHCVLCDLFRAGTTEAQFDG